MEGERVSIHASRDERRRKKKKGKRALEEARRAEKNEGRELTSDGDLSRTGGGSRNGGNSGSSSGNSGSSSGSGGLSDSGNGGGSGGGDGGGGGGGSSNGDGDLDGREAKARSALSTRGLCVNSFHAPRRGCAQQTASNALSSPSQRDSPVSPLPFVSIPSTRPTSSAVASNWISPLVTMHPAGSMSSQVFPFAVESPMVPGAKVPVARASWGLPPICKDHPENEHPGQPTETK